MSGGSSTISDPFYVFEHIFGFRMDDFFLEFGIVSDLFDFGFDDEESSSESGYERQDMRGRGPRAPRVARNPYNGSFYNGVYIKNADEQTIAGPNGLKVLGKIWNVHLLP
ncbi:unnamed protein product [Cylindrotheca closterium]|uniref:Uncharacterized protein n=1 Tax=Cylindrotheca closterium TaxID=2856 RepID=A0AAD2CQJ6_9STRA|nr:unnamed protein product [Cylindrotheca closterium]